MKAEPGDAPVGLGRRLRRSLGSDGHAPAALTLVSGLVLLIANFGTGVILAHALGPSGRGATVAITMVPTMIAWLFAIGSVQTLSFFQAKDPDDGGRLLGTWLALTLPLGLLAIAAGELLLPSLLAAQSQETLDLARKLMLLVVVMVLNEALVGMVLGDHRFLLFNAVRALAPGALALAYLVLELSGKLTVESAVIAFATVQIVSTSILLSACVSRHGVQRPAVSLARPTIMYGLRAHGAGTSTFLNARLDLVIVPAFLSASSVGLYSVATGLSWIVIALAGPLWQIVVPLATRSEKGGAPVVRNYVKVSGISAAAIAAVLAIAAPWAIETFYGASFLDAVPALRVLLPGSVLFAVALILVSGLFAANRPLSATLAQGAGVVVTLVGLPVFLQSGGGILAAAIVSSVAYSVVFAVALIFYRRVRRSDIEAGLADPASRINSQATVA